MSRLIRVGNSCIALGLAAYPLALAGPPPVSIAIAVATVLLLATAIWLQNETVLRCGLVALAGGYGLALDLADRGFDAGALVGAASVLVLLELFDLARLVEDRAQVQRHVARGRLRALGWNGLVGVLSALVIATAAGGAGLATTWLPFVGAALCLAALRLALPASLRKPSPPP